MGIPGLAIVAGTESAIPVLSLCYRTSRSDKADKVLSVYSDPYLKLLKRLAVELLVAFDHDPGERGILSAKTGAPMNPTADSIRVFLEHGRRDLPHPLSPHLYHNFVKII